MDPAPNVTGVLNDTCNFKPTLKSDNNERFKIKNDSCNRSFIRHW